MSRRDWLLGLLCLALIGGGCWLVGKTYLDNQTIANHSAPQVSTPFGVDPATLGDGGGKVVPAGSGGMSAEQVADLGPNRLVVEALSINARIVQVSRKADGVLTIPDPYEVGHWDASAAYDDASGSIVLAGHVDDAQQRPGAMAPIAGARPGMVVWVTDAHGVPHEFVTVSLREYVKQDLPAAVFSNTGPLRLSLITCGGPIIRTGTYAGHYRDNVVLTALPATR